MRKKSIYIKLIPVTKNHYHFLYDLLKERNPITNISHKTMPTYEKHVKFIKSKPYSKWYIIKADNSNVGTIYLTKQNEIGIFLKKENQVRNIGKNALNLLMKKNPQKRYLTNINPKNKNSIRFFKNNGFQILQYTYEIKK